MKDFWYLSLLVWGAGQVDNDSVSTICPANMLSGIYEGRTESHEQQFFVK